MRACPDCHVTEVRQTVEGRAQTNLDPVSGRCIKCSVARSKAVPKPMPPIPADYKLSQAGDEE